MSVVQINEINIDVESPCVRNCCLDGEDICLGCNRHIDEIMAWRKLSNEEKYGVLKQCEQRQQLRAK